MTVDVRRLLLAATVGLAMAAGASSSHASTSPQVAMQPDGTAHIGWHGGLITERSWAPSGSLSSPQHLSPLRASIFAFDLSVDSGGAASFIWLRQKDKRQVEARRRHADGSLGPLLPLTASATDTETPHVATSPAGTSVFVWRRTGSPSYIHARRLSATGVLGPTLTLSSPGASSREPEVAMDANGKAMVVWVRPAPEGGDVVQLRSIAPDGALGPVEAASAPGAAAGEPQIAFDASGNALVAWLRDDGNGFYPQIRRRSAGGTWSNVQTMSAANGQTASHLRLAVAPGGGAMAVWLRSADERVWEEVQAAHRAAAGTLGSMFRVSLAESIRYKAFAPQVAMDRNGNALVVWHMEDQSEGDEKPSVLLRRRAVSGGLGTVHDVSTETTNDWATYPGIGIAADGTATLVWDAFTFAGGLRVHARKRRPNGTLTPIVDLDQP